MVLVAYLIQLKSIFYTFFYVFLFPKKICTLVVNMPHLTWKKNSTILNRFSIRNQSNVNLYLNFYSNTSFSDKASGPTPILFLSMIRLIYINCPVQTTNVTSISLFISLNFFYSYPFYVGDWEKKNLRIMQLMIRLSYMYIFFSISTVWNIPININFIILLLLWLQLSLGRELMDDL